MRNAFIYLWHGRPALIESVREDEAVATSMEIRDDFRTALETTAKISSRKNAMAGGLLVGWWAEHVSWVIPPVLPRHRPSILQRVVICHPTKQSLRVVLRNARSPLPRLDGCVAVGEDCRWNEYGGVGREFYG